MLVRAQREERLQVSGRLAGVRRREGRGDLFNTAVAEGARSQPPKPGAQPGEYPQYASTAAGGSRAQIRAEAAGAPSTRLPLPRAPAPPPPHRHPLLPAPLSGASGCSPPPHPRPPAGGTGCSAESKAPAGHPPLLPRLPACARDVPPRSSSGHRPQPPSPREPPAPRRRGTYSSQELNLVLAFAPLGHGSPSLCFSRTAAHGRTALRLGASGLRMPARLPQVDSSARRRAASARYGRRGMRLTAGRGAELPAPPLLQVIRSPLPPRAEPAAQRPLLAAPRSYACTARLRRASASERESVVNAGSMNRR